MVSSPVLTTELHGITLAYQERGSGFPLLLINGFASCMDTWNPPLIAALARHFRVIIFDNRGTGYSSASAELFSIPLFAKDTAALMDALGIARTHILGLSMGASIAQELVLAHPGRVERLVLVAGTCGEAQGIRMSPEVWERLTDKRGTVEEIIDRMFSVLFPADWLSSHDPLQYCPEVHETVSDEIAARQAEAFLSWPGSFSRLDQIRVPTLILTGSDDVVILPENSRILAGRIHGARLIEIAGAGHGLQYQCPDRFSRLITDFLRT